LDICYSDLIADPEAVIKKIYDHFGYEFTPEYKEAIHKYMENNPKGKYGKAPYSLESFCLDKEKVRDSFEEYIQRYSKFF